MARRIENAINDNEGVSRPNSAVFILLCVIPAVSVIGYGAVDALAMSLLALAAAMIVILWAADAWTSSGLRINSSSIQIPVFGLILIGFLQLLPVWSSGIPRELLGIPAAGTLSMDPYATRFFLIRLIILFVFFAAALAYIDSRERLKKLVFIIIVFGGVMAFVAILLRLASPDAIYGLRPTPHAVSFGSFVNQHHFAAFMEMTAGLTFSLLLGDAVKKDRKMLLGIAAALMGIAVVFSGSRGGLISLIAVIGIVVPAQYLVKKDESRDELHSRSRLLMFGGAVATVLVILGLTFFLGGEESFLRAFGLTQNQADVTSGRLHFWSVAWQIFMNSPIFGAGYDTFGVAFSRYDTWMGTFRIEQAHNDYLQTLADAGIAGFGCVAAFIFLIFRKSLDVIRNSKNGFGRDAAIGAMAGCSGILIHSFFDFPLRTTSNAFFFLLLIVIAVAGFDTRRRKTAE
ncbi:MAG: O-antigen ligase family protein [Pyrinomonadaceae bacterium]